MASSYIGNLDKKKNINLNGLILLAAYPINDSKIETLSIYGSNDLVLNKTKLKDGMNYLEIEGGIHS